MVADGLQEAQAKQEALAAVVPIGISGLFVVRTDQFPDGVLLPVAFGSTEGQAIAFRESLDDAVGSLGLGELFEALQAAPRECATNPCVDG